MGAGVTAEPDRADPLTGADAVLPAPRVAHVTTVDLTLRFLLLEQLRRLRDEGFDVTAISAPGEWVDDLRARASTTSPGATPPGPGARSPTRRAFFELVGSCVGGGSTSCTRTTRSRG